MPSTLLSSIARLIESPLIVGGYRICPIGTRIREFEADPVYIDAVLADGAQQASSIAAETMKEVKTAMGLAG